MPSSSTMREMVLNQGTPMESAPEVGSTGAVRVSGTAWVGELVSVSP